MTYAGLFLSGILDEDKKATRFGPVFLTKKNYTHLKIAGPRYFFLTLDGPVMRRIIL